MTEAEYRLALASHRASAQAELMKADCAIALIEEAVQLFNDGLNIGLGWVARAERLLDERE